ncbi:MAG: ABC transporter permease [Acidobacteria bacterium]|nr:ABC transporter permease [Acidobacteriota bacterium]
MRTIVQDVKYSFRLLIKKPAFSILIILTLALGIGANTALFSVLYGIVFKPLAVNEPARVVTIYQYYHRMHMRGANSPPNFVDIRNQCQSFDSVAGTVPWNANLVGDGEPSRVFGLQVSSNFFQTIGAQPVLGRAFVPEEEQAGAPLVVILSHSFWKRQFAGDPTLLGKTINCNAQPYTVVGVMPPGFSWGRYYGNEETAEMWVPFQLLPERLGDTNRGSEYLDMYARLKPGVTLAQAHAEVDGLIRGIHQRLDWTHGTETGLEIKVRQIQEEITSEVRPLLTILFSAVGLVLLIACANIANLILVKIGQRQSEIAVRMALGAGKWRIIQQLLTEALMLSIISGLAGLGFAWVLTETIQSADLPNVPRIHDISFNWVVAFFGISITILTGCLCGIAPAIRAGSKPLTEYLRSQGRTITHDRVWNVFRNGLAVTQIALAVTLMAGSGLLLVSLYHLLSVNPGFQTGNLLTLEVSLPDKLYDSKAKKAAFFQNSTHAIRQLPGIQNVDVVTDMPLSGSSSTNTITIENYQVDPGDAGPTGEYFSVTPNYFQTMGIPIKQGRGFTEQDRADSKLVVVIDEVLARRYWPNENPIGKRFHRQENDDNPIWREIVGVVGQIKNRSLNDIERGQYYMPVAQVPVGRANFMVRTASDPLSQIEAIKSAIHRVDPQLPIYKIRTMDSVVAKSLINQRLSTWVLGAFAAVALLLSSIGIYGVLSISVVQRFQEFGIRMALGAKPADVFHLVLGQGIKLIALGVVIGLTLAYFATRLLESVIFGVNPSDPAVLIGVTLVLALVAVMACVVPSLRALRINPIEALREG